MTEHVTSQSKVYILYTGGTIGMAPEAERRGSHLIPRPLFADAKGKGLFDYFPPAIKDLGIDFTFESLSPPQDSSNLKLEHWVQMADMIRGAYDNHDGFVILHGTDTMSYTSSALAFMFENLAKPVVITGSQLPISAPRTDAIMNLANSIYVAGYRATQLACIPEVVIVFADKILRGCRARKVSSSSWAGFDSPNCAPLGHIGEHIRINTDALRPLPAQGQEFQVNPAFAESKRVMDVSLFPGFEPSQLSAILNLPDVQGVILRTFGSGNAPDYAEFLEVIEQVRGKKTIVNTTQCLQGMVEMGLYAASSGLLERGVISALDMTPEAVLAKLMWTLGTKLGDQIIPQMQVNQRGEQTENLFDLRYGACGDPQTPKDTFRQYCTPDRRLSVARLTRAVVRFSRLGLSGIPENGAAEIRVFLNSPNATGKTPGTDGRCVAKFTIDQWKGAELNQGQEIDNTKARSLAGDGDITLTVVADEGVRFWFSGLYLALFTEA